MLTMSSIYDIKHNFQNDSPLGIAYISSMKILLCCLQAGITAVCQVAKAIGKGFKSCWEGLQEGIIKCVVTVVSAFEEGTVGRVVWDSGLQLVGFPFLPMVGGTLITYFSEF